MSLFGTFLAAVGGMGLVTFVLLQVGLATAGMVKVGDALAARQQPPPVLVLRLVFYWLAGLNAALAAAGRLGPVAVGLFLATLSHVTRGAVPASFVSAHGNTSAGGSTSTSSTVRRSRIPGPDDIAPPQLCRVSLPSAPSNNPNLERSMFDFGPTITGLAAGSPAGLAGSTMLLQQRRENSTPPSSPPFAEQGCCSTTKCD